MTETKYITNLSFLHEVAGNSSEMLTELIDIFIEQAVELETSIPEYLQQQNWIQLGAIAHKAKSSVRTMGMDKLGYDLEKIEHLSRGNVKFLLQQKKDSGDLLTVEEEKLWNDVEHENQSDITLKQLNPVITNFLTECPLAVNELEEIKNQL